MSEQLRAIDITRFAGRFQPDPSAHAGPKPEQRWIRITSLRIDPRYQRDILRTGEKNIIAIALNFKWSKFGAVIVAPIEGGLFSIIDGQHRTIAAALCRKTEVPCNVVTADRREQAESFAAVNGNVTAMSSLQLHAARVASGDAKALALADACAEADVTICRYPVPANKMRPGDTLAVGVLKGLLEKFGREVFVSALCCITQTRCGNVGMIRAQIVEALCAVLEAEPSWWSDRKRLIRAMQTFDFAAGYNAARAASVTDRCTIAAALVDSIGAHLETKLPVAS